jgi:serine/threonine protein kinase
MRRSIRKKSANKRRKSIRKKSSRKKSIRKKKYDGSSELGSGMSSVVYLVVLNDKQIAVKMLNNRRFYEKEKYILQEINKCTDSSLIIRLLDYIDKHKILFIEYNDMVSMEDIIDKIPDNKKLHIAKKLFEALQIIHNCNITHGDFKAKNTLISPDYDDIKVIDFGLSEIHTDTDINKEKRILQDYTKFKFFLLQLFFNAEYDEYIYEEYPKRILEMNNMINPENKEFIEFFNYINHKLTNNKWI